jgi:hypothetical protein
MTTTDGKQESGRTLQTFPSSDQAMTSRNLALLSTALGALCLFAAAICVGLGWHESATIPVATYKDPALGFTLAPWFAVPGLALLGMRRFVRHGEGDADGR